MKEGGVTVGKGRCRKCTLLVRVIVVAFFTFSSVGLVPGASAQHDDVDLECQKGVSGFPGATFPKGDILLREGDTLEVFCRLDPRKTKHNATYIRFHFTKTNISRDLMKTTVLNETTAVLRVERMNVSSPNLFCEITPPDQPKIQVCQNEIDVGYPPLPVEDFKCTAPEWKSLNCTWRKPYNPIPTEYVVQILDVSRRMVAVLPCPNTTVTPTSCIWGPRTEPFYRQNRNPIKLRINGTNVLKPKGQTWDYNIDHWSIVIPDAPSEVKFLNKSGSSVAVSWGFGMFKDFVAGLYHKITVCIDNAAVPCNVTTLKSQRGVGQLELNVPLNYAYTNYTVEIRMRSQVANDTEEFWSHPASISITSESRRPDSPPKVDVGSYESVPKGKKQRSIYVYWEEMDVIHRNGPGFHYEVSVHEDEDGQQNISPTEITSSYAKFEGLGLQKSYHFYIVSVNDVGNSSAASTIYVPKQSKAPKPPTAVSKLDFTNGSFVVTWHAVHTTSNVVSYTVFKCGSSKPRPYQCQGRLEWDLVPASKQSITYYKLPHENIIYQFAVAANTQSMSSGMAWASCTLIHGKVPEKLKKLEEKFKDESEIHIEWQLDCAYKPGVIDGFKISYCQVEREKQDKCVDNEKQEAVSGANITSYTLKNLNPCFTYMIAVSIISENGDSQKSDPIYVTTKPSAPSHPPKLEVSRVSNTSVFLVVIPQYPLNGILKEFRISYTSNETGKTTTESQPVENPNGGEIVRGSSEECLFDGGYPKEIEIQVPSKGELLSNSPYTASVSACTSKCSKPSLPVSFQTLVGASDVKGFPSFHTDGDDIIIQWQAPSPTRGPIDMYQVLVKENGHLQILDVLNEEGVPEPHQRYAFSCKTSTNLTAQVRAVTFLDSGNLTGNWSPPGNFNCGGGTPWIIWVAAIIGAIVLVGVIVIISTRFYQKVKDMKEVNVKLPPGLDLKGLSHHQPRRRKMSDGDTHSWGKENLSYQLQQVNSSHQNDDPKDLFSESSFQETNLGADDSHHSKTSPEMSCSAVNKECVQHDGDISRMDNYDTDVQPHHRVPSVYENVENESLIPKKMMLSSSPTTKNLLLDDTINEDEAYAGSDDLFKSYNVQNALDSGSNGTGTASFKSSSEDVSSSGPTSSASPLPPVTTVSPVHHQDSAPSGGTDESGSGPFNALPTPTPVPPHVGSTSYVKWTTLPADQLVNGGPTMTVGLGQPRKTPYCQIGIVLDSN